MKLTLFPLLLIATSSPWLDRVKEKELVVDLVNADIDDPVSFMIVAFYLRDLKDEFEKLTHENSPQQQQLHQKEIIWLKSQPKGLKIWKIQTYNTKRYKLDSFQKPIAIYLCRLKGSQLLVEDITHQKGDLKIGNVTIGIDKQANGRIQTVRLLPQKIGVAKEQFKDFKDNNKKVSNKSSPKSASQPKPIPIPMKAFSIRRPKSEPNGTKTLITPPKTLIAPIPAKTAPLPIKTKQNTSPPPQKKPSKRLSRASSLAQSIVKRLPHIPRLHHSNSHASSPSYQNHPPADPSPSHKKPSPLHNKPLPNKK